MIGLMLCRRAVNFGSSSGSSQFFRALRDSRLMLACNEGFNQAGVFSDLKAARQPLIRSAMLLSIRFIVFQPWRSFALSAHLPPVLECQG